MDDLNPQAPAADMPVVADDAVVADPAAEEGMPAVEGEVAA